MLSTESPGSNTKAPGIPGRERSSVTIAEAAGVKMPSFFGYLVYSGAVLLPLFGLVTVVFFGL